MVASITHIGARIGLTPRNCVPESFVNGQIVYLPLVLTTRTFPCPSLSWMYTIEGISYNLTIFFTPFYQFIPSFVPSPKSTWPHNFSLSSFSNFRIKIPHHYYNFVWFAQFQGLINCSIEFLYLAICVTSCGRIYLDNIHINWLSS